MVAVSGWQGGRGAGLTWATLINSSDIATLANGSSCLSSVADITNGTSLDQFMDISFLLACASNTIAAAANFAFWLYLLNQDGSTYGDNKLPTPGTPAAITPSFPPVATWPIPPVATTTSMWGNLTQIVIPPGSFRVAIQNNCGFAFTGTQTVKYRTYNIRLDNAS